ncbi:RICIN domain-containing protein, partial [Streptomyces hundungensis]|uniref:RICIN domain-containing protein n=1 Tax=Streptomyces hundungensis TaxID=1077946 RepID=UPI003CD09F5E
PTAVQVDPGRAGFAEVELTAVNVSWFGGTRQHPFTVGVLRSGDPAPQELRGTYLQPSVFPRWVLAVGSILLALLVVFVMIWLRHDTGVKSQAAEQAPARQTPLPKSSQSALPSPPPTPSTQPAPPPSAPASAPPKPESGGSDSGGGGPEKPQYDPTKPVRIQSGLGMYLTTTAGQWPFGDLYVYAAPDSPDQPTWDQKWYVRPLPQDEFALTSSTEPKLVADSKREGNMVRMWEPSGGESSLTDGQMASSQKWSIQPIDGADGFVRLVSKDNKWCMSDLTPNDTQHLQVIEARPCGALPADQQRWRIAP